MSALLRRLVDVRDKEAPGLIGSFIYFFFLLSSYYVMRPLREEMGVAGGVNRLPWLFTGTFVATLAVVPLWGALVASMPRRRLVPLAYRFFALTMVLLFVLLRFPSIRSLIVPAVFIWISVYNLFVVSVFWSLMADLYSAEQGKRLFGFVAAGGTAGAIAGPFLAAVLAPRVGPANLLLVSAGGLEMASQCAVRLVRRGVGAPSPEPAPSVGGVTEKEKVIDEPPLGGGILAGISQLLRSSYLLTLSAHVLLFTMTATVLYFQQANITARAFSDSGLRTAFFARIDLAVNVLSLLVQAVGTGRIMKRIGAGAALGVVVLVTLGAFGGLAASPGLTVLFLAMTTRRSAGYALERPAREVLFTVVSRAEKYKAKNFIDTVVYRGGDAATAWLQHALTAGGIGTRAMVIGSLPVTGLWLLLVYFLGKRQETLAEQQQADILDR
ncbi:MAG TPA: MFS transporter [Polyangiaceae bacterium]|nr:MFS transporter [Polyangiaceae bacterium]